ncbi:hypothetical protein BCR35DRAFT_282865 [Leucosporidium creatinivorum]|uniref:Chromatin modification-related protein n=1 Tax=Leucosporidium creatinivorum TaxID=106004 RepID=A0A1Y2E6Y3_9BASI|nr:hypothetical protein BCR35DRAFT_282865 [Leucosporidium creatinivorum]
MASSRPQKRSKIIPILPLDTEEEEHHQHLPQPQPAPPPAPAPAPEEEAEDDEEEGDEEEDERHRVWDMFSDEYHDIVTELPLEFQRNFHLIRELEDSQQSSTRLLQTLLQDYITSLTSTAPSTPAPTTAAEGEELPASATTTAKERLELISKTARNAIRAGEDKVGLAVTLYESVDRHIRRLDSSLLSHSDTLLLGLRSGTQPSHEAPQAGEKEAPGATTGLGARALGEGEGGASKKETKTEKRQRERKRKREERRRVALAANGGGAAGGGGGPGEKAKAGKGVGGGGGAGKPHVPSHFVETVDMAFDPTEPTYCYCDRVSFGDMIGCENEDCLREWFHMECVGLTAAPSGVWFCRDCGPKAK